MRIKYLVLLLTVFCLPAFAGTLSVTGAWLRLLPGDLPLAGYAHVTNNTGHTLVLTGASSPEFSDVQLHRSVVHDGMDNMLHIEAITIEAGKTLDFIPGGYHLMLFDRKHLLSAGQHVPVTLRFSDGTQYMVKFVVKGATGQ
ncbi:MAG TPA: copper chaperone PCu(A)C [Gammaproteobacteria bacterium]|nr:copper chaperone PCu(A)C [Gammaproteobacteria bacterium]